MERKNESIEKTYFVFYFLENYYVPKDEVSKFHLNVIKKSNLNTCCHRLEKNGSNYIKEKGTLR